MQTSTQDQVSSTFLKIVEKLTFMFGEHVSKDELEADDESFVAASMTFSGDLTGQLTVAVPTEITGDIAANILGLEPEDVESEEMRRDAVAEMLNVVCGHVIMVLAGPGADFKLEIPVIGSVDEDTYNQMMLSDDFLGFMLDENPAFLGLSLEN